MLGRIVSLTGPSAAVTQAKDAFASQGVAILKSLPGLQTLHVFFNPAEGRAAIVSIWTDEEKAKAAMQAMAGMQQKIMGLGLSFKLEDYDVVA